MPRTPTPLNRMRRRSRSETPRNHKRRRDSNDEAMMVLRNSIEPGTSTLQFSDVGSEAGPGSGLFRRVTALCEKLFPSAENNELKREMAELRAKTERLITDNKELRFDVSSLKRTIELKVQDCIALRARLEDIEPDDSCATPTSNLRRPWGNRNSALASSEGLRDGAMIKLQRRLADSEDVVRKLMAENTRLRDETTAQESRLQAQTAEFASELEKIQGMNTIRVRKVSDTEIQAKWKTLEFDIRQFVSKYFPEPLLMPAIERLAQEKEFNWLPEIVETLQSPILHSTILESWIWHALYVQIFDPQSEFWAGNIGKHFSALSAEVEEHTYDLTRDSTDRTTALERLHDWRVRSAHLFHWMGTNDGNNSTQLATNIMCSLKTALPKRDSTFSRDLYRDILDFVHKAAKLDKLFRMSKAHFTVFITRLRLPFARPPKMNFRFDHQTMEGVKDLPTFQRGGADSKVDLAVSPGLLKAGNADGANYEHERVLVKLRALCNLHDILDYSKGVSEEKLEDVEEAPRVIKEEDDADELTCLGPSDEIMVPQPDTRLARLRAKQHRQDGNSEIPSRPLQPDGEAFDRVGPSQ